MRTVAIVNQKGGCGKTTTAINLASCLARMGMRTLLVDLDPQGHCAVGLGVPEERVDLHIGDAMLLPEHKPLDESRLLWRVARNLELAPASVRLAGLESARGGLNELSDKDQRLSKALDRLGDRFDWRIIDCPPSIGLLTFNAIRAATEALIPVESGFFALRGAERQVRTLRSLARRLGGQTPFRLIGTMHDPQSTLACELVAEMRRAFEGSLAPVIIRYDVKLKEAVSLGQALCEYDADAKGARDYTALAEWLLANPPSVGRGGAELSRPVDLSRWRPTVITAQRSAHAENADEPRAPEIVTRAADLASRAKTLLAKSAQLQARLTGDPDVTQADVRRAAEAPAFTAPPLDEKQLARMCGACETTRGVRFAHPGAPNARIAVAGDFNGWSAEALRLRFNPANGLHEVETPLPPGRREYRLIVNGRWVTDSYNGLATRNSFGESNSVVIVTQAGKVRPEGAD